MFGNNSFYVRKMLNEPVGHDDIEAILVLALKTGRAKVLLDDVISTYSMLLEQPPVKLGTCRRVFYSERLEAEDVS